jgi:hypothetical protein
MVTSCLKGPGRSGSFQEKSLPAFPTPGRLADIFSAVNSCSFGARTSWHCACGALILRNFAFCGAATQMKA